MKFELVILLLAAAFLLTVTASPVYEVFSFVEKKSQSRPKRAPGGDFTLEGSSDRGEGGYRQDKVRAEYNHRIWGKKDGARVEANGYYERNWGQGPKEDYGGRVNVKIPF